MKPSHKLKVSDNVKAACGLELECCPVTSSGPASAFSQKSLTSRDQQLSCCTSPDTFDVAHFDWLQSPVVTWDRN